MLEDEVGGEFPVSTDFTAEVESVGVVVRRFRRAIAGSPIGGAGVAATGTFGEFVHGSEMDGAIGDAIFHGVIPTAVFGVAAAGHGSVISDVREGIGASGGIVLQHGIGTERALPTEGQRAESLGRYASIVFVVEGLAGARAVDCKGVAAAGKSVVDDLSGRCVGKQAGLGIDSGGCIEDDVPALRKLYFAPDTQTRLLQVIRCGEESALIAVAVYQRFAFVVMAVVRQSVTDPAEANVIRAVERDAVPGQRAIGGGEFVAAGARVGSVALQLDVDGCVPAGCQGDSGAHFLGEA